MKLTTPAANTNTVSTATRMRWRRTNENKPLILVVPCSQAPEESKHLFFEKKKQKTFSSWRT
jgi:hypothetical protein